MRFMVIALSRQQDDEHPRMPSPAEFEEMGKYQEELVKAGVLVAGEGLRPTALGARLKYAGVGMRPHVVDGPLNELEEVIAGFSIIKVASKAEAIEWASRAPFREGAQLEIRQLFEDEDFAGVDPTGELRAEDDERRRQYVK